MKRRSSPGPSRTARARRPATRAKRGRRPERDAGDLRSRAEAFLRRAPDELARMPIGDLKTLIHELQVHQIELEIQNEELRRAQLELAEARDRYTDLYEFAPAGYLALDGSGRIRQANLRASTLLAVERSRLIGRRFSSLVLPEAQEIWHRHFAAVRSSPAKQTCELAIRRSEGEPVWVYLETISISPKEPGHAPSENRVVVVDITDRKRAEEALRATNQSLAAQVVQRRNAEEALRESAEQLRAVVDTAVDAILTIDASGAIRSVNPATERLFGYGAEEMIGNNVRMLMPAPYREEHDGYIQRYFETGEPRMIGIGRDVAGCRKDGGVFPIDLSVSQLSDAGPMFTAIIRDVTERNNLQRAVAGTAIEEQQAIGRELHDGVAQRLTGVEMLASVLHQRLQIESSPDAEALGRVLAELRRTQEQLRGVIKGVYQYTVPADGLRVALRELSKDSESLYGLRCTCEFSGPLLQAPDANTATQLYYIAREAVHNAVRHARASAIAIGLEGDDRRLLLTVWDDGKGIEPASVRSGMGTQIMEYRAGLIGGALRIRPARSGGTVVSCLLHHRASGR